MIYHEKTEEELKQLAKDFIDGKVYTDMHDNMQGIKAFMPIMFMDESTQKKLLDLPVGLIYEYLDKAAPLQVNNMPRFTTMRILSVKDKEKLNLLVKELEQS